MLKLASPNISEEAIAKVGEVLRSGNLVQGEYVKKFEEALKEYIGTKHAVVVSSGTAALHLSLISLGIGPGDEVIVPAFTFPATANVVSIVGAKPVFVDISLEDYCINVTKIEEAITLNTKAIIPVHEFGMMADMDPIIEIANRRKLHVIEDAACALGSEYNDKKAGTFGIVGCFSFHPRKAITTGEGGVVVTNIDGVAEQLISIRNHGMSVNNNKIDFIYAGLNYRMTDFQAVLGLSQLQNIEKDIFKRLEVANSYDSALSPISWIKPPKVFYNRRMVYQTYHILLDKEIDRNVLIKYLKTNGIETNYGAVNLLCQPFVKRLCNINQKVDTNSNIAYTRGLALPLTGEVLMDNILFISNLLLEFRP